MFFGGEESDVSISFDFPNSTAGWLFALVIFAVVMNGIGASLHSMSDKFNPWRSGLMTFAFFVVAVYVWAQIRT